MQPTMNKIVVIILLIITGLHCSAQVPIQTESNEYKYRNSITQSILEFKSCSPVADTVDIYRGDELVHSFVYVPGNKHTFPNLRAGKYYFISDYFNDSVVIKADKIFIRNELLNCEP